MQQVLIVSNLLVWLAVVVLGALVFALTRQIGVLYERIAPAGALMVNQKLTVGQDSPQLQVADLNEHTITVGAHSEAGRSLLLFFLSPTCPVCKTLIPSLKSARRSESAWLDIVLGSDGGDVASHRKFVAAYKLDEFPYIASELLGRTFGVSKLPYAVLIDEAGRLAALGIINSREHLESLFESKERGVASIQAYLAKQGE